MSCVWTMIFFCKKKAGGVTTRFVAGGAYVTTRFVVMYEPL